MRTFLFSDLRDYTAFIETKGDQAATKMLRASRRIVRAAVAKHRGAEIKTEGDSFYVVFRSPSPAVRCAIDIQRGTSDHNARHPDVPVRMGIGINTGEAVPHDKGYVGSAVVIAGRLSTTCAAGQIVVTDTVRALVRTGAHAPMRELGAWTLKGVAEPVRVFEVDAGATSATHALRPALPMPALLVSSAHVITGLVICPELVQREGPLAALTEHLAAAAKGNTRIVAISGEGGVGKSRLVRELAAIAHREGHYVLGGRSHVSGRPYDAIVAALRPYAHARGAEILKRLLGALMVELRRLLPEVDLGHTDPDPDIPSDERRDRFLRTISLLLEDAASQRPVLLVLEDFHDADEATRDVIRHLATTFHSGMCVVMTYREEEVGPAHPLRALLAELDRDRRLARVALGPLDLDGVTRMTQALAPKRENGALARAVFERSEGIPFYVEELLKTALDDPEAKPDEALPRTIADSVQVRLSRLVAHRGPGIADLLEAAAVAEVPLGYETVVRLSGRDETQAGADLAAAIDAQLLERSATRAEIYRYRHALTREAVAALIPPARKRRLHGRVAQALEAEGDPSPRAAMLARHFAAAGDHAKALAYGRQGAANAMRVSAYATAIDLLRDAAAMASGTPEEAAVLEEIADPLMAASRVSEAQTAVERAREIARASGDRIRAARLDVRLARILRIQGRRADATQLAEAAISALETTPGPDLARSLVALAELFWADEDWKRAEPLAARALDIARAHLALPVMVQALTIRGTALIHDGSNEGWASFHEAIALGTANDLPSETIDAYFELARAHLFRGQSEDARAASEAALELAKARGYEYAQARILAFLTTLLVNSGRYRDARGVAERAVALSRPDTVALGTARLALANVLVTQAEYAAAIPLLDQIEADIARLEPDRRMVFHAYRAQALAGLRQLDEAKREARHAVEIARSLPSVTGFLNAADIAEIRRDASWTRELQGAFEAAFAGRDNAAIRAVRAELAAVRMLAEDQDPGAQFERSAAEYETLGAKARSAFRRASAAIAQLRDPQHDATARKELGTLRSSLADWGAMRYASYIDDALARSGRPLSWIVTPPEEKIAR